MNFRRVGPEYIFKVSDEWKTDMDSKYLVAVSMEISVLKINM